jgi:hypothetical protein
MLELYYSYMICTLGCLQKRHLMTLSPNRSAKHHPLHHMLRTSDTNTHGNTVKHTHDNNDNDNMNQGFVKLMCEWCSYAY